MPNLVTVSVFLLYTYEGNQLLTTDAFVIITVFLLIRIPLRVFPFLIQRFLDAKVSLDRIDAFLRASEVQNDYVRRTLPFFTNNNSIMIENGNFY